MKERSYYSKFRRRERITCNIIANYTVITEFMKRHSKLSVDDLHLLCYLASFYKYFNWNDIFQYPNGMGIYKSKNKIREFLEDELIEYYDPYHRDRDIKEPYVLTVRARNYVKLYDDLMLMSKKISYSPISSDEAFVSPVKKDKSRKNYNNWYKAIEKFNKIVEENIK